MKLVMVIDPAVCIDCRACLIACKVENDVPAGAWRNWVRSGDDQGAAPGPARLLYQPGSCQHCDDPPCVRACPTGASFKQEDGVVLVDRDLCVGCGYCLPACPFGARYRHAALRVVDKCDFCQGRRQTGGQPACVETCPVKARLFGDLDDPAGPVRRLLETRSAWRLQAPGRSVGPNLYYLEQAGPADWPTVPAQTSASAVWTGTVVPVVHGLAAAPVARVADLLRRRLALAARTRAAGRDRAETSGRVASGLSGGAGAVVAGQDRAHAAIALHWANAAAWLALLTTGLGLLGNPDLAPLGAAPPRLMRALLGDGGALLRLHVLLGGLWAVCCLGVGLAGVSEARAWLVEALAASPRAMLRQARRSLTGRGPTPDGTGGRYDPVQRGFALAMLGCGVVLVLSGGCLVLSKTILDSSIPAQWALPAHSLAAGLGSALALAHALGRLFGPGTGEQGGR